MAVRAYQGVAPKIDPTAFIDETAVVIGNVVVGADSSIWPMSVVRGDIHSIRIGRRTNVQDGCILHVTDDTQYVPGGFPLEIGNDVTVGHGAILHACVIEDLCLIGMGAIVLDGAVVESGAMIGAGALVPPGRRVEGGYLWVGSPVKKVRPLRDEEKEYLSHSMRSYVEAKNRHGTFE